MARAGSSCPAAAPASTATTRAARYCGREFEEVESQLRGEYEDRHREERGGIAGLWERFREEIRTGWNRARGK